MDETQQIRRLILVYDADTGKLNAFLDSARKLLGRGACALCEITHGLAGEKSDWRRYRSELGLPVDYLHRDEISGPVKQLVEGQLPCVVVETDDGLQVLLAPDVLARCRGSVRNFKGRLLTHAAKRGLELPASRAARAAAT